MEVVSSKMKTYDRNVNGDTGSARNLLRVALAVLLAIWVTGVYVCPTPAKPPPVGVDSLVVLHTNDIHSHLFPFLRADSGLVGGAAARNNLIARERAQTPDLLLLDAGDVVQGTPVYNLFRGEPDMKAMAAAKYDAVALGNHDLDDGPRAWLRLVRRAGYPAVSANVFAAADSPWVDPDAEVVPVEVRRGARWVGGVRVPDAAPLANLAPPEGSVAIPERIHALPDLELHRLVQLERTGSSDDAADGGPDAASLARVHVPPA